MTNITRPSDNFADIDFGDLRIRNRAIQVVEDLTKNSQKSLNLASGSRANAKAAYRLLANENFTPDKLISGITAKTLAAMADHPIVLLVQDTMDVNYNTHKKTEGLGYSSEKVKGIKVHSCIALTEQGIPVGLMSQSCTTRDIAKVEMSESEKSKRPIEQKESNRWLETVRKTTKHIPDGTTAITVCDRECDFYEFYNEAESISEKFVVRVVNNRITESGEKLRSILEHAESVGTADINIPRDSRRNIPARVATLSITYASITLKKPVIRKETNVANSLTFNVVRILEQNPPQGVEPIEWILATNLPIANASDAFIVVQYYVERWKIERFHHVLKSGCKIEKIQQRSVQRIIPLMLIYSCIALFILSMTLCAQNCPNILCDAFFDEDEWKLLFRAAERNTNPPTEPYPLSKAIEYLGRLAGRKLAPSDGKLGVDTIWQGLFAMYLLVEFAPFVGQG